jgi:hypothetical protein
MITPRRHAAAGFSRAALSAAFLLIAGRPAAAQSPAPGESPVWAVMPASLLPMRLPVDDAPGWRVQGTAADFEAADALPVRDLSGQWSRYAPRDGRNVALQSARIELGASRARWEVTALVRADILITGPRSTWDAVHTYKQRQTPADGSEFALQAHERGVLWAGVRAAHTWVLRSGSDQGVQLTGGATLLSVRRVQQVDATGQVRFSSATGYGFEAQAQRQDSHQQFGGYGEPDAHGTGYSADLGLLWQPSASTFVNVSAVDLLSHLEVNGVSTQQATLSSATNSVDSNGYLNYQPLVTGRFSAAAADPTLSRKWVATAGARIAWSGAEVVAGGRWERIGNLDLPALWIAVPVVPGWLLQVDGEFRFRSICLGLMSRHGTLMLRTRSLQVGQSQALGWQASFSLPL